MNDEKILDLFRDQMEIHETIRERITNHDKAYIEVLSALVRLSKRIDKLEELLYANGIGHCD